MHPRYFFWRKRAVLASGNRERPHFRCDVAFSGSNCIDLDPPHSRIHSPHEMPLATPSFAMPCRAMNSDSLSRGACSHNLARTHRWLARADAPAWPPLSAPAPPAQHGASACACTMSNADARARTRTRRENLSRR
eukprot:6197714-Pleurochrysis_carterae.AAC.1